MLDFFRGQHKSLILKGTCISVYVMQVALLSGIHGNLPALILFSLRFRFGFWSNLVSYLERFLLRCVHSVGSMIRKPIAVLGR